MKRFTGIGLDLTPTPSPEERGKTIPARVLAALAIF